MIAQKTAHASAAKTAQKTLRNSQKRKSEMATKVSAEEVYQMFMKGWSQAQIGNFLKLDRKAVAKLISDYNKANRKS